MTKQYQAMYCPIHEDIATSKNVIKSKTFKTRRSAESWFWDNDRSLGSCTYWIGRIR